MTGAISHEEIRTITSEPVFFHRSLPERFAPRPLVIEVIPAIEPSSCQRGSWGGDDAFSYDFHGHPRQSRTKGLFVNTSC
jgi:hypothetical protein